MQATSGTLSIVFLTFLGACGGGGDDGESKVESQQRTGDAQPVMGSFELPDTSYAFRVIRCDLTGTAPDGIFLRGSGTMPDGRLLMPDGRTLSVEIERLTPDMGGPLMIAERATVRFGSFMDEDGWEATAMSSDGNAWRTGDMEALDAPIIQVSGNDLVVAATYKHASRDEQLEGTLRVTCPAGTSP